MFNLLSVGKLRGGAEPWKGLGGTDWGRRLRRFGLEVEAGGVATLKASGPSKLRSAGMGLVWGAELLAVIFCMFCIFC